MSTMRTQEEIDQAIITLRIAQRDMPEDESMHNEIENSIDQMNWVLGRESRFEHVIQAFRLIDESDCREEVDQIVEEAFRKMT